MTGPVGLASHTLVGGYLLMCVGAGVNGALRAPADLRLVAGVDPGRDLPDRESASLLSTWRFLRAIEAAFGLLCLRDWRRIHQEPGANATFSALMGAGVAARVAGRLRDGRPNAGAYLFGGLEAAGLLAFCAHTRPGLRGR